jgi:hypothetical protein
MTRQKRFIVVFASKDGIIFNRAVVWDDDHLNSALIGMKTPVTLLNAGASFMRATNLMHEINNLKNGYTATIREYDTFSSIPENINIGP